MFVSALGLLSAMHTITLITDVIRQIREPRGSTRVLVQSQKLHNTRLRAYRRLRKCPRKSQAQVIDAARRLGLKKLLVVKLSTDPKCYDTICDVSAIVDADVIIYIKKFMCTCYFSCSKPKAGWEGIGTIQSERCYQDPSAFNPNLKLEDSCCQSIAASLSQPIRLRKSAASAMILEMLFEWEADHRISNAGVHRFSRMTR